MEQWLSGLQPGLDDAWGSRVSVDGSQDSIPSTGQYVVAALVDPDGPALWPHVAGLRAGDGQARSTEKVPEKLDDSRDVRSLMANLRTLIRMCDGVR